MEHHIKIPFKVSARTARLIGRENIATSKGAIIELVKNGYDADSNLCIVYFDNYFSIVHKEIDKFHFDYLINKGIPLELLDELYDYIEEVYYLKENIEEQVYLNFKLLISKLSSLYIIDTGEGMTQNIIQNNWMTIGTDNKAYDYFTKTGRVKAGAKGIGRFALDKLGNRCEMITIFNPKYHETDVDINGTENGYNGYQWIVNWEDFEGEFKTIENVNADLIGIKSTTLKNYLYNIMKRKAL